MNHSTLNTVEQWKNCSKCGEYLLVAENFYKSKNHASGFCASCKECERKRSRNYHYDNLEKNRKRLKELSKAYPDSYNAERSKKYYDKNRMKILKHKAEYREENREVIRDRQKRYKSSEKGILNEAVRRQKRRSLSKKVLSTLTAEQWSQCLAYFDQKCCYCAEKKPLSQDHFIPLSKGGSYTRDNIVPACINCNSQKYNTSFGAWYPTFKFYDEEREKKILKYLGYTNSNQQMSIL